MEQGSIIQISSSSKYQSLVNYFYAFPIPDCIICTGYLLVIVSIYIYGTEAANISKNPLEAGWKCMQVTSLIYYTCYMGTQNGSSLSEKGSDIPLYFSISFVNEEP